MEYILQLELELLVDGYSHILWKWSEVVLQLNSCFEGA